MFKHTKIKSPEGSFPIHAESIGLDDLRIGYVKVGQSETIGVSTDGAKTFKWSINFRKHKSESK